jgi:hypothetical protein
MQHLCAALFLRNSNCKLDKVVAALMFWSDSTHLTNFGNAKLWPIYMLFENLSKYIRAKSNSGAEHHVAYIPSVSPIMMCKSSSETLSAAGFYSRPDLQIPRQMGNSKG